MLDFCHLSSCTGRLLVLDRATRCHAFLIGYVTAAVSRTAGSFETIADMGTSPSVVAMMRSPPAFHVCVVSGLPTSYLPTHPHTPVKAGSLSNTATSPSV